MDGKYPGERTDVNPAISNQQERLNDTVRYLRAIEDRMDKTASRLEQSVENAIGNGLFLLRMQELMGRRSRWQ